MLTKSNLLNFSGCGMLLAFASAATAQTNASKAEVTPTIVFVCEHGSAKSVVAAAHFNRLARERGLPYRAVSRGIKPDDAIAQGVRTGLALDGIDVTAWQPQAVTDKDLGQAAKVVSLATDLPTTKPFVKSKLVEWNDIPSVRKDYTAARSAIVERVMKLVESLAAAQRK